MAPNSRSARQARLLPGLLNESFESIPLMLRCLALRESPLVPARKVDCVDGRLILSNTCHMHPQQSLNRLLKPRDLSRARFLIQKICGDHLEASVRQSDRK